jgi:peptide deformylase
MIYPIIRYGQEVLRQQAQAIPHGTEIKELIDDMFATMDGADGVGLAAPQIGKSIQLFVVDTSYFIKGGEEEPHKYRKAYINPELVIPEANATLYYEEGCLSIPGIGVEVPRHQCIRVKFFDSNWQLQEEDLLDMPARVIQHEYDHLVGKLFIDYLPEDKQQAMALDLEKIKQGKIQVGYPMQLE